MTQKAADLPGGPPLHRRLLAGWVAIAERFGFVQTLVILAVFYATLIGPASLAAWLARRDLLDKRRHRAPETAWLDADSAKPDLERARLLS
jgi:hypothetical protein